MSFTFQHVQADDLPTIYEMMLELARHVYGSDYKIKISLEKLKKDFCRDPAAFSAVLVKDGNTAIGYAIYCFKYLSWTGEFLYLDDLYIKPECRSSGIGRKLISHLAQIASEQGCAGMEWYVENSNGRAIKFYETFGLKTLIGTSIFRCKELSKLESN